MSPCSADSASRGDFFSRSTYHSEGELLTVQTPSGLAPGATAGLPAVPCVGSSHLQMKSSPVVQPVTTPGIVK